MKHKRLVVSLAVLLALFLALTVFVRTAWCDRVVSEDGNWELVTLRTMVLASESCIWEGVLIYKGNSSGDAGEIKIRTSDAPKDGEYEVTEIRQHDIDGRGVIDLLCGLWGKAVYPVFDMGQPHSYTKVDIKWTEDGVEKSTTVELNGNTK